MVLLGLVVVDANQVVRDRPALLPSPKRASRKALTTQNGFSRARNRSAAACSAHQEHLLSSAGDGPRKCASAEFLKRLGKPIYGVVGFLI